MLNYSKKLKMTSKINQLSEIYTVLYHFIQGMPFTWKYFSFLKKIDSH